MKDILQNGCFVFTKPKVSSRGSLAAETILQNTRQKAAHAIAAIPREQQSKDICHPIFTEHELNQLNGFEDSFFFKFSSDCSRIHQIQCYAVNHRVLM